MAAAMTVEELEQFLRREFPQAFNPESGLKIEAVWEGGCRMRQAFRAAFIRPGDTVSGPTLMGLADIAMYVAVLGAIGPVALAVTTSLNINFLRKAGRSDLLAEARLLKVGRRLAIGEVLIHASGRHEPVAQATVTYSIPPGRA
jgi:uncharacterized protein (TIGR00369 family)